ncbi:CoA transferase [Thermomicrobiaceae bacterium CFH 74404]|uniref:CoA transferase n=1 Tax=Thermalbibacter longus TaxID=2951981 RepID=A0AA41WJC4_9BACT|nr:CaiB/BaiF CoA-transferase family protein [Thermalbibacter longus]MCM8750456.1 CoA transferase [Thermalbibacter longus]
MPGPLEGIRVLDLSRVLAGPFCTMILGDLGADVIKVEQPGSGDDTRQWGPPWAGGESAYYLCVNRNKRSITLNLKHERGREILVELARDSDVVVENFRVGMLDRMGIGYQALAARYPRLIWCSITGYGLDGPYAERAGYDFVAQGEGGLMSITGEPDGEPMKVGVAIVDLFTGLYAASAILAALHARSQTGRGQLIDVALLPSTVAMLANVGSNYLVSGQIPKRYGNAHPNIVPYQTFRARDRWMTVAVGNDRQFRQLCRILGMEELADDPRFATNPQRVAHRDELIPLLQAVFETRDADDWLAAMTEAGIPCGPINTLDRVFSHPQILHRGMVIEVPHPTAGSVRLAGPPFVLSETPAGVRSHPPLLGEHTEEILRERLGLSTTEIARLREEGVV